MGSENKTDVELEAVEYFNNTIMDADQYLEDSINDILKLEVNSNGQNVNQIQQNNDVNVNMGVS